MTRSAQYWPVAEYRTADGRCEKLWTYQASLSMADARRVVSSWAESFHLLHARIDAFYGTNTDGSKPCRSYRLF